MSINSNININYKYIDINKNNEIIDTPKKVKNALTALEKLEQIITNQPCDAERIKNASKKIFDNYSRKRNSLLGKILTIFYSIFFKTDKENRTGLEFNTYTILLQPKMNLKIRNQ